MTIDTGTTKKEIGIPMNSEEKFFASNQAIDLDKLGNTKPCFVISIFNKVLDVLPYGYRMFYYDKVKPIFKPQHSRIRKSIPKTWMDIGTLIENVNFEMIKSFYEDEYSKGYIDWESDDYHKNFSNWLKNAYKYISEIRPKLENDLENAYPSSLPIVQMFKPITDSQGRKLYEMVSDGIPYEKKYAEVIRIENLIEENDTEILIQMIKFRKYFWT